jgi:hypothetical protein
MSILILSRCHVDIIHQNAATQTSICASLSTTNNWPDILKFGITYQMVEMHSTWRTKTPVTWFSAFTALVKEATIVEDILKLNLSSATVLGSREYVDVSAVAKLLGCDYEPGSYTSYANVACSIYMHTCWNLYTLSGPIIHTCTVITTNSYPITLHLYATQRTIQSKSQRAKFPVQRHRQKTRNGSSDTRIPSCR